MLVEQELSIPDPIVKKNVQTWLAEDYDAETKATIRKLIKENPSELIDAFYTNLSFGTAGLRGIMGVGCNRLNQYTIKAATQGLANYLKKQPKLQPEHSVFIGYDSRHNSRFFAEEAAKVLAANGIRAYICQELRPTPLVSFGCRFKKCSAAIMVTASHNPADYNGYKVYWNDGGQIVPPHDEKIIEEVKKISHLKEINEVADSNHPLIEWVGTEIDDAYLESITPLQHYPEENKNEGHLLNVVYSNLHGAGITLMPQAMSLWGFSNVAYVEAQKKPDGNFPTVSTPNPEEFNALKLGIEILKNTQADILIATDPDADRVCTAVRHHEDVVLLNGNQMACLCLHHVCEALSKQQRMPEKAAFIKTIGTTELFQAIADYYNKPCFNVLTGFKYIAEKIHSWEKDPNGYQFIFGGEESCGYLLGTQARDKDAILSSLLICEMALHQKRQGKTLVDLLHDLYRKQGFFLEKLLSITFDESKLGKERMASGVECLQHTPPKTLAGVNVVSVEDYQRSIKLDLKSGKMQPLLLPKSPVLLFWLEDGSKVMVRPSGTEPKIKLYCGVFQKHFKSISEAEQECKNRADRFLNALKELIS